MARSFSQEEEFQTGVAAIEMLAYDVAEQTAIILMLLDLYSQGKRPPRIVFEKISAAALSARSNSRLLADAARSVLQVLETGEAKEKSG